ncbi:MAG: dihydrofolate reductase [Micavibrio sp.]
MNIRVSAIVAMGRNRAIGKDNQLLWHIPAEFQNFKKTTLGKPIIMGRRTYESLGRPLPGRINIVISRNPDSVQGDVFAVDTLDKALARATAIAKSDGVNEVFIIGGAQIYREGLPLTDRLYLTVIDRDYDGDTFFPEFDMAEWSEISSHPVENDPPYTLKILERKI